MKKIYLFILWFVLRVTVSSQNYIPFPNTFAIWTISHYSGNVNAYDAEKVGMFGDTVINTYAYKKLYQHWGPNFNMTGASYAGALRESHKNIYMFYPGHSAETILYNFNLVVGDTAKTIAADFSPRSSKVIAIDSVMVNGRFHKRWTLGAHNFHEDWIEGVGSSYGLLATMFYVFDHCQTLMCVSKDTSIFYSYTIPVHLSCEFHINYDCDQYLATSLPEKKQNDTSFRLFPNPFSGNASLVSDTELNDAELLVYNFMGQELMRYSHLDGKEIQIRKGNLSEGTYFYKLMQKGVMISKGNFSVQ